MKRNSLVKLLSVIVGIMVIVASVVCLTTVNAADDFGTEADGITVANKTAMDSWTATEGLKNGDFSEGLKYWGPVDYYSGTTDASAKASDVVEIVTSGTESYAKFNGSLDYKNAGIQTTPITVPAAKVEAGDKLAVLYKGDANPSASSKTKIAVRLYQYNTADGKATIVDCAAGNLTVDTIDATWSMLNTTSGIVLANATESENYTFSVSITAIAKTCIALVDDVQIVKVKDDGFYTLDGLKLDENGKPIEGSGSAGDEDNEDGGNNEEETTTPVQVDGTEIPAAFTGTEADGITTAGKNALLIGVHAAEWYNADFSQGLKYWGREDKAIDGDWTTSQIASVLTEGENKYLHIDFNESTYTSTSTSKFQGIRTIVFSIDETLVEKGDVLVLMGKYKNGTSLNDFQFKLHTRNSNGETKWTSSTPNTAYCPGVLKAATETEWGIFAQTDGIVVGDKSYSAFSGIKDTDIALCVEIVANNKYTTGDFDDFKIVKYKDGVYTELDGTAIDLGEVSNDPAWAGTETEGVTMYKNNGMNNIISEGFPNADFEKGLKYWASKSDSYYPADVAEIKTEANGNKYLYLKGNENGYYGLKSSVITIPASKLNPGDQLVVVFDYKDGAANTLQIPITQRFTQNVYRLCQKGGDDIVIGNDWCTAYTKVTANTLEARQDGTNAGYAGSDTYAFQLMIEAINGGDTIAIDNLRICKLVGTKIVDLDGNVVCADVNNPVDNTTNSGTGSIGTGTGNGSGTGNGTSATTGETLPIAPLAVAALVVASSAVMLRKKVR